MQDAVIAGILCFLGFSAIVVAAVFAFKQTVYVDQTSANRVTEIDVPIFGKLKTNTPAIALCFVGAIFAYLAYDLMRKRIPDEVRFEGEVSIDQSGGGGIDLVMVGITSGSWMTPATPNGSQTVPVIIKVPNNWPSYAAFAFTTGSSRVRPVMLGSSLENPKFQLSIKP